MTGKSVITSYIIEDVLRASNKTELTDRVVCYHHCDYADVRSLSQSSILSSLSYQLLERINIPQEISSIIEDNVLANLDAYSAHRVLKLALERFQSVIICLDGVDELEEPVQWQVLTELDSHDIQRVKIIISCRTQTPSVRRIFSRSSAISVSGSSVDKDIESYIRETLNAKIANGEIMAKDDSLRAEISSALLKGANTM